MTKGRDEALYPPSEGRGGKSTSEAIRAGKLDASPPLSPLQLLLTLREGQGAPFEGHGNF